MKRFLMMALVAVFVLGTFGTAMAETEFSGKGTMQFLFEWADNTNFFDSDTDGNSEDDFVAAQRTRLFLNAAANENVKATLGFEIDTDWGFNNGADLGGDEVNVETKRAMLTFKYPGTDLTFLMGLQGFALPGAVAGSPILDDDLAAMAMAYKFNDMVSMTTFWARLADTDWQEGDGGGADEFDAAGLILPISFDGASLTPYFMYGWNGANSNENALGVDYDAWWFGAALEVSAFDPIFVLADLIYGAADLDDSDVDIKGWFADVAVGYKMDMVTPMVAFLYSSGQDEDGDDITVMPTVAGSYGLSSFGSDGSPTAINRGSSCLLTCDGVTDMNGDLTGFMGIGLVLADMSFIDSVSHTFRAIYYTGTSDDDAGVLFDEEDSAWEINFDTKYALYENLSAYVEMGYFSLDLDDVSEEDDAMKLAVGLKYSF